MSPLYQPISSATALPDGIVTFADLASGVPAALAADDAFTGTYAALLTPTAVKTGNYTAAVGELVLADTTGGGFTVTAPTAVPAGRRWGVVRLDGTTNVLTLGRQGSDTYASGTGTATSMTVLLQDRVIIFESDGAGGHRPVEGYQALTSMDARYPTKEAVTGKLSAVGQLWAQPTADATTVALIVQGAASQSVDLARFRDSTTATLAWITKDGRVRGTNLSEQVYNVKDYGADNTGVANAATAINNAINAASTAGGGIVYVPAGTYLITAFVTLKSKVNLVGAGREATILIGGTGLTSGVVVGTSGNAVSDLTISDLTINGGYATASLTVSGLQITNGARAIVTRCRFKSCGGSAVLLSNHPDGVVSLNEIDDSGQGGNTGAHGICIVTGSHRARITFNRVLGARAMGIGFSTGASTDAEIIGNYVDQASSTTYECIGVITGCDRTLVANNICMNSQDNGISLTPNYSIANGNIISGALNHGISLGGNYSNATGNRIRNVGTELVGTYGGIALGGTDCVVVGNTAIDDQGSPTMGYGVKEIAPANNNVIIGNRFKGQTVAEFLRIGADTIAILGTRPTVSGSRGSNAALASLLTALGTAGLVNDTTTA